jgi:hypothetical protein
MLLGVVPVRGDRGGQRFAGFAGIGLGEALDLFDGGR